MCGRGRYNRLLEKSNQKQDWSLELKTYMRTVTYLRQLVSVLLKRNEVRLLTLDRRSNVIGETSSDDEVTGFGELYDKGEHERISFVALMLNGRTEMDAKTA